MNRRCGGLRADLGLAPPHIAVHDSKRCGQEADGGPRQRPQTALPLIVQAELDLAYIESHRITGNRVMNPKHHGVVSYMRSLLLSRFQPSESQNLRHSPFGCRHEIFITHGDDRHPQHAEEMEEDVITEPAYCCVDHGIPWHVDDVAGDFWAYNRLLPRECNTPRIANGKNA